MTREEFERKAFFSGKTIIKWYQYQYHNPDDEAIENDSEALEEAIDSAIENPEEEISTGDPSLDDEVARIMAAFKDAHQDAVDSCFASMESSLDNAGNNFGDTGSILGDAGSSSDESEEDLISKICAPKQNSVDFFVNQANK